MTRHDDYGRAREASTSRHAANSVAAELGDQFVRPPMRVERPAASITAAMLRPIGFGAPCAAAGA